MATHHLFAKWFAYAASALAVLCDVPVSAQAVPCTAAQLNIAKPQLSKASTALDAAIKAIDHPTSDDLDRLATWLRMVTGLQSARD